MYPLWVKTHSLDRLLKFHSFWALLAFMKPPMKPAAVKAALQREEREAAALRENLRRRKEQQRARCAIGLGQGRTEGKTECP